MNVSLDGMEMLVCLRDEVVALKKLQSIPERDAKAIISRLENVRVDVFLKSLSQCLLDPGKLVRRALVTREQPVENLVILVWHARESRMQGTAGRSRQLFYPTRVARPIFFLICQAI